MIVSMACLGLYSNYVLWPELEKDYQNHKAEFNSKSCADLEKIIHYSDDTTQANWAKKNYNERCLP